jgi:hypothetical protein
VINIRNTRTIEISPNDVHETAVQINARIVPLGMAVTFRHRRTGVVEKFLHQSIVVHVFSPDKDERKFP